MTIDAGAVERALDEIRPHLHGECADCSLQQVTLRTGVERVVKARVPAVRTVESIP